jgi:hypothetical protein
VTQLVAVPFESSRRKIARAKHHIADLKERVKRFGDEHPYEEFRRKDMERMVIVIGARLAKPFPEVFDDIASDAVQNLRAALDHACYAMAVAYRNPSVPREAYFPFSGSEASFEANMNGRCRDIPEQIHPLFRRLKPYKGGDDLLYALNEITIRNEHTVLTTMGSGGLVQFAQFESSRDVHIIEPPVWDSTKHEIEIAIIQPDTHFKYHIKCGFSVTFSDIDAIRGQEALGVLNEFVHKVENIVLAIEAMGIQLGIVK